MSFRGRNAHPDELISASLSGDLTGAEKERLDAHLAICDECRATLAAFREQRAQIGRLRAVDPPRDLAARVRAGIETAQGRAPWWRRPSVLLGIGGSLATVAAGVLAVVVLSNLRPTQPVAVTSAPPASATESISATASAATPAATLTEAPSPSPAIELRPGQLAAIIAQGGTPTDPVRHWVLRDFSNSRSITVESAPGVPVSAALSPNGTQLAYITSLGESGARAVRVLDLTDGSTIHLGCSDAWPFTERLVWSPDGSQLAYTRAGIALGAAQPECADAPTQDEGKVDVWIYSTQTRSATRRTVSGDAYAADYRRTTGADNTPRLIVSHAAEVPWSEELVPVGSQAQSDAGPIENVFLPRLSPDGTRAMFWRGTMDGGNGGAWTFVTGGMPWISEPSTTPWKMAPDGMQLFTDLLLRGSDGFDSGNLAWSPDSQYVAFWNGAWTGTEPGPTGGYPDQASAYVGAAAEGLTQDSRVNIGDEQSYVEDVTFDASGQAVLVMVAQTTSGVGDAPTATVYKVPLDGGEPTPLQDGAGNPVPWIGPPVVASEAPTPAP